MTMINMFCVITLPFIYLLGSSIATNINDTETLHTNLFQNYNKNVRPIYNQSSAISVNIILYIKSVQEFDEVNEKFSYVGALASRWADYKMQWNPADYGGLSQVTLSYGDVWVPELTLSTAADTIIPIGKSTDRVRFNANGAAAWMTTNFIESTCSVNVRNYPFDTQSCTTSFASLGYKNYEVTLTAIQSSVAFNVYSPNALWDVVGSHAGTVLLGNGGESEIFFTIKLKRKSAFVIINVLMPMLVLSLLNVFVFVLVPESGERIGYCITTLLAIAVYMTIVSDTLPRTSKPVPLISYKLLVDVMVSGLIVIVTILNMKCSNKSNDIPVPAFLKSLYKCLSCSQIKSGKVTTIETDVIVVKPKVESRGDKIRVSTPKDIIENESKTVFSDRCKDVVTWRMISGMVDAIAFFVFTTVSIGSFVTFILLTKY